MIYVCDKCRFFFERAGEIDACPGCGKAAVREADKTEQAEYRKNLQEKGAPKKKRIIENPDLTRPSEENRGGLLIVRLN
jgi:uncharacterized Zn finger protein (UPF0148 family)